MERSLSVRLELLRLSFDRFSEEKKEILPHFSISGNIVTIEQVSTKSGDLNVTFRSQNAEIRDLTNPPEGFEILLSKRKVLHFSYFFFKIFN